MALDFGVVPGKWGSVAIINTHPSYDARSWNVSTDENECLGSLSLWPSVLSCLQDSKAHDEPFSPGRATFTSVLRLTAWLPRKALHV